MPALLGAPAPGPGLQLGDRGAQVSALFGQRVGDAHRGAGLDDPFDEALVLELTQPAGEKPVGEARHSLGQLAKSQWALGERAYDGAGPAPADQLDGFVEVGADAPLLGSRRRRVHFDAAY